MMEEHKQKQTLIYVKNQKKNVNKTKQNTGVIVGCLRLFASPSLRMLKM